MEKLLPFARKHRTMTAIRMALELVARRQIDPLAVKSACILATGEA